MHEFDADEADMWLVHEDIAASGEPPEKTSSTKGLGSQTPRIKPPDGRRRKDDATPA